MSPNKVPSWTWKYLFLLFGHDRSFPSGRNLQCSICSCWVNTLCCAFTASTVVQISTTMTNVSITVNAQAYLQCTYGLCTNVDTVRQSKAIVNPIDPFGCLSNDQAIGTAAEKNDSVPQCVFEREPRLPPFLRKVYFAERTVERLNSLRRVRRTLNPHMRG